MTVITMTVTAPSARAQQSATIRASARVVSAPMSAAVLDTAVQQTVRRLLARPHLTQRTTGLPAGAQVVAAPAGTGGRAAAAPRVREVRVEYVAN